MDIKSKDWRLPENRREAFIRFFDFHVRYRAHPGAVYYVFPYLAEKLGWSIEDKFWFAFLNGNTQNPMTSKVLFDEFQSWRVSTNDIKSFLDKHWERLEFDLDRRWQKKDLPEAVRSYQKVVENLGGGSQERMWLWVINNIKGDNEFQRVWNFTRKKLYGFGRLSTFSYLEYLKIFGLPLVCRDLHFEEKSGSRSHRNGLAFVLGRDDIVWDKRVVKNDFDGIYTEEDFKMFDIEAKRLLEESILFARKANNPYMNEMDYFTMESTLCCYKSWHKPDRRYPNVYNDMFHNRIIRAENKWPKKDFGIFWDARRDFLPVWLRVEENPKDKTIEGNLWKKKQNHYLLTGEPIMMSRLYPYMRNGFEEEYYG